LLSRGTRRHAANSTEISEAASTIVWRQGSDSQDDSQHCECWRAMADISGLGLVTFHLAQTPADMVERQKRGLQNRLW
jgi:hypothetical protein